MADTKTTAESTRSPLDGTEFVRLATTGANWKVAFRDLFSSGLASPDGFLNDTSVLISNILSNGVIVPPNIIKLSSDPAGGGVAGGSRFIYFAVNGGFSGNAAAHSHKSLAVWPGILHSGVSSAFWNALDVQPAISSTSTGPFDTFEGMECSPFAQGSGTISNFIGLDAQPNVGGTCNISNYNGVNCIANGFGSGTITTMIGGGFICNSGTNPVTTQIGGSFECFNGGITLTNTIAGKFQVHSYGGTVSTNVTGVQVLAPTGLGATTNVYGITVADQTGIGGTASYNIYSQGTTHITPSSTKGGNLFVNPVAIGNYADLETFIFNPGDTGGAQFSNPAPGASFIVDQFATISTGTNFFMAGIIGCFNQTTVRSNLSGLNLTITSASQSTAHAGGITGIATDARHGSAQQCDFGMTGGSFSATNAGGGAIGANIVGGNFAANQFGGGTPAITGSMIGGQFGVEIDVGTIGGKMVGGIFLTSNQTGGNLACDNVGVWASTANFVNTTTNSYGILVDDFTSTGSSIAENIRSKGANSHNTFEGYVITTGHTVSSLQAAATAGAGARSFVTDATSSVFAGIVVGSGSTSAPVYSDGTNWRIG